MQETGVSGLRRRTVLKKLALGSGVASAALAMPEKWVRPIVSSVVLPVHATTTNSTYYEDISGFVNDQLDTQVITSREEMFAREAGQPKSVLDRALDVVIAGANAQKVLYKFSYQLCIKLNNGAVSVDFVERENGANFIDVMSGNGSLGSTIDLPASCGQIHQLNTSIVVTNPGPAEVDFTLNFQGIAFNKSTLSNGSCSVPEAKCPEV